MILLKYIYPTQ